MLRRASFLTLGCAVGLVLMSGVASADDVWGSVECGQPGTPSCDLVAGSRGSAPARPSDVRSKGGKSATNCRYIPVQFEPTSTIDTHAGEAGHWAIFTCLGVFEGIPVWVPAGAPTASPIDLAQVARRQLALPPPDLRTSPTGEQLVGLPTWLWIDPAAWRPRTQTVTVPGASVTAIATPRAVSWSLGDGGTIDCTGPGTPYAKGGDPRAPSPTCGYLFRRSSAASPGEVFRIAATIHWTVTWSGAGESGTFDDLTSTGAVSLRVAESQTVNGTR